MTIKEVSACLKLAEKTAYLLAAEGKTSRFKDRSAKEKSTGGSSRKSFLKPNT